MPRSTSRHARFQRETHLTDSQSSSASSANQIILRGMQRLEQRRNMEELHFSNQQNRAAMNPPIDYRALEYVKQTDGNLVCAICHCPFVDPVVLSGCDHCFCRECIRLTWAVSDPSGLRGNCPSCRARSNLGARSSIGRILANILNDLEVLCPHSEAGCQTQIRRGEVQDHINLYCGYGLTECLDEDCHLPILRKDSAKDCMHHGVSCYDCRTSMMRSDLERHWKKECPDRKVYCDLCEGDVFYRELDEHNTQSCPAISVPCPGAELGCTSRFRPQQMEIHTRECALAKMAPHMLAQKQRLDEHEAAQREMNRKLESIEKMIDELKQRLSWDRPSSIHDADEDEEPVRRSITIEGSDDFDLSNAFVGTITGGLRQDFDPEFNMPAELSASPARSQQPTRMDIRGSSIDDMFDVMPPYITHEIPAAPSHGPFTSPMQHFLSMLEDVRSEHTRTNAAMQELDGRLSMQTLNENLRTREELAYLSGEVGGLRRQLHWLTSTHLQRQQGRAGHNTTGEFEVAGAGAGVEAAVNAVTTAASAIRAAARIGSGSHTAADSGSGGESSAEAGPSRTLMRRRASEEGRTKL